jgi:hypothetical protein
MMQQSFSLLKICLKITALAVAMGIASPCSTAFALGGNISGGGSIVKVQGTPVLLDLLFSPSVGPLDGQPGQPLPKTKAFLTLGFDRLNQGDFAVTKAALERVSIWEKTSPVVTGLLQEALTHARLYYTQYRIGFRDTHYFIPPAFAAHVNENEFTTIAYYAKNFGILVSQPDFDELDFRNQVALVIHESLRHVQIQYGYLMSDASVQKMTAAIVDRDPQPGESLDSRDYADNELLESIERPKRKENELLSLRKKVCEAAIPYAQQMSGKAIDSYKVVCRSSKKLTTEELRAHFMEMANEVPREDYYAFSNAASEAITLFVDEILAQSQPSSRRLIDVTVSAYAVGIDKATEDAQNGRWWSATKLKLREGLINLVNLGYLKQ